MSLTEYRRKRRFQKTAEPKGKQSRPRAAELSFVVQKHAASHLHYDFRLELDGVLKSWAVPKGPSLDPKQKRLAVHVEDHPLEYASFEGTIPAGEYGGGEVIVWDRGTWIPDADAIAGLSKGKLEFALQGEKLTGGWRLIQIKGREGGKNWLLMKRNDDSAITAGEDEPIDANPESVLSGRTVEALAVGKPAPKKRLSKKAAVTAQPRTRARRKKAHKAKTAAAKLKPIQPQLARLATAVPTGEGWVYEIKYDGYRLVCTLQNGVAQLWTRNQLDWTHRFAAIAAAAAELPVQSAILDGEVVALDENGVSNFQALQNSLKGIESRPLVYYDFDLLHLNGEDLQKLPLTERKARLQKLLGSDNVGRLRYSDHLRRGGDTFLKHCCQAGLEGIISKRGDRPYTPGRTDDWLKIKCLQQEELVIGGFTISAADKREFGALLLGYFVGKQLKYAGRVGTGFTAKLLTSLRKDLVPLITTQCPFGTIPPREKGAEVRWVDPKLVAQIQFAGWTTDRVLRHPSFLGLREDKTARAVGLPESLQPHEAEAMSDAKKTPPKKAGRKRLSLKKEATTVDYPLTNPDRILYPELGLTKLQLADYYQQVAKWMLPYLNDRPLSLLRCPEGQAKTCFFQKHAAAGTPDVLRRIEIEEKDGKEIYLIADDLSGLLSLAQMGVLEIHLWGSRSDRIEQPDWLVFDLDPAPDVAWKEVVSAAHLLREVLSNFKLETFVKVTGGKGVHIVAPLSPRRADWDPVKLFTQRIAQGLAEQYPDRFIAKMSKAARKGKIFIDYLRNDRGSTAIAPYSTRAKGNATVSVPLQWEELTAKMRPDHWTVENVPQRLASLKRDPWKGFFEVKQSLPKLSTK
jgi:bifunctional non-homologous end joining protein LigD